MARQFKYDAVVNVFDEALMRRFAATHKEKWGLDNDFDAQPTEEIVKEFFNCPHEAVGWLDAGLEIEGTSCIEAYPEQIPDIAFEGPIPAAHRGEGVDADAVPKRGGVGQLVDLCLYSRVSTQAQAEPPQLSKDEVQRLAKLAEDGACQANKQNIANMVGDIAWHWGTGDEYNKAFVIEANEEHRDPELRVFSSSAGTRTRKATWGGTLVFESSDGDRHIVCFRPGPWVDKLRKWHEMFKEHANYAAIMRHQAEVCEKAARFAPIDTPDVSTGV